MMRLLHFNFAPKPRQPYIAYAFLAAALLLASYTGWCYLTGAAAQTSADARLSRGVGALSAGTVESAAKPIAAQESSDDLAYERDVNDRLSVPWDALFREIESSVDDEVVLLGVESNSGRGTVSFIAEARSLNAMIAYARRLRTGNLLYEVEIMSHKIIVQDSLRPVRFVVNSRLRARAQTRPAAPTAPD
ncbi:hypothetical protein [Massilia rubra]|uniref:Uncharacterized protein n=1 Tax=Massilia rubra TaxID=2607910 RepID=A0ABX0LHC0_9BURK|nr:hypothetical protein [Massilia rubra]NHZ32155.1 hypothetical protein [Massilia rubra]